MYIKLILNDRNMEKYRMRETEEVISHLVQNSICTVYSTRFPSLVLSGIGRPLNKVKKIIVSVNKLLVCSSIIHLIYT